MKNKELLKAELAELNASFKGVKTNEEWDELLEKFKAKELELKQAARAEFLADTNRRHDKLRALAVKVWACEQPTEDITTNDGSWHKVKVKKYPNIAALEYSYGKFREGKLELIHVNGEKFRLLKWINDSRPDTFEEFLSINYIMPAPITLEQYEAMNEGLKAAEQELKAAHETYSAKINALDYSIMNSYGLLNQRSETVYTYQVKQ